MYYLILFLSLLPSIAAPFYSRVFILPPAVSSRVFVSYASPPLTCGNVSYLCCFFFSEVPWLKQSFPSRQPLTVHLSPILVSSVTIFLVLILPTVCMSLCKPFFSIFRVDIVHAMGFITLSMGGTFLHRITTHTGNC